MNEQRYPFFERLHVLRTEALTSIRDRAFDLMPLYCVDFGDGILTGCQLTTNRDSISIGTGIIKFNNFLYLLKEPMSLPYQPTDRYTFLKIKFDVPETSETFIERKFDLFFSEDEKLQSDEIELCRFKLNKGAMLRSKYVDFADRVTEYDTVNEIYRPHAAPGGSTIAPQILQDFVKEIFDFAIEPIDFTFCMVVMSGSLATQEQISFYLMHKLKLPKFEWSNETVYKYFLKVIEEIKGNGEREINRARRGKREIIVD